MARADNRARHEFPVRPIGKNVDEVHRKFFRIVVNHYQIAEVPDEVFFVGFDLHLRGLLVRHFSSMSLRFKLSQILPAASEVRRKPSGRIAIACPLSNAAEELVLTIPDVKCSLVFTFI
jgi:hypothetical protein